MTETPEQRVARLEAELAQAKVDALQKELQQAQADMATSVAAPVFGAPLAPPGAPPGSSQAPTQGPSPMPPSPVRPDQEALRERARNAIAALNQTGTRGPVHLGKDDPNAYSYGGGSTWLPDGAASPAERSRRHGHHGGEPVAQLAPGPRPVPLRYRLVLFPFRWWTVWTLFMVAVAPIALWGLRYAATIGGIVTFLGVTAVMLHKRRRQLILLKRGEVAEVSNADLLSRGTYYSGTTYQNCRLAQAHGWHVTRQWYSGPGYKTRIDYTIGGRTGSLVLRGLSYDNGVILADPRKPSRALCVSSFPYDVIPDASGQWGSRVRGVVLWESALMTLIVLAWTAGMVLLGLR